jgi:signal transduction histidine kinase
MHLFALIPLIACAICTGYCLAVTPATYDRASRRSQMWGKALFACPALWAFTEVALALVPDAESGAFFAHLALLPIVAAGPMGLGATLALAERPDAVYRRTLPPVFAVGAALLALGWFTDLIVAGLVHMPWGFVMDPGPLFGLLLLFAAACSVIAFRSCFRMLRSVPRHQAKRGGRMVVVAVGLLVIVGNSTDGLLPMFGYQVPRLATTCFALIALSVLWTMSRLNGYIFSTPAITSGEILRSLNEGVAFVTLKGRVLLANESMATLLCQDVSDLVGQPFGHYLPGLALDRPQQRIDMECELVPDVGEPIAVAASVSTARDLRGDPLGLVIVVRDLREIELLRSRLVTSDRLAAVGQLAAGIAHEINNPLAFVRTNLGVLKEHWTVLGKAVDPSRDDGELGELLGEGDEIISESIEGIDRAARIVRDVREFSHAGSNARDETELNELLERVIRVATPQLGSGITVERDYADVPQICASAPQLEQVFLNLLVNAIQAVGAQGRVRVSTRAEGDAVRVEIADDGCGIAPGETGRIFDPFYTTKPVGEGTGLGLSISHEIIRDHDGEVAVGPGLDGRGTCFTVRLRLDPSAVAPAQ